MTFVFGHAARYSIVNKIDIRLVAHGKPGGKVQPVPAQVGKHLGDKAPALRGHADKARRVLAGEKCGVEPEMGVDHADAVGTQKTDAVFFGCGLELFLKSRSVSAH